MNRTASADFPPVVAPGSTHELRFSIAGEAIHARDAEPIGIVVPVDQKTLDVTVGVVASDFEITLPDGSPKAFTTVAVDLWDTEAIAEARFRLTAHDMPARRETVVYVTVYRGNLPIGQLSLLTAIDRVEDVRSVPLGIAPASAQDPDFVLVVTDQSPGIRGDGPFDIFVSQERRYFNQPLGSFPVSANAWEYARDRLASFWEIKNLDRPEDRIKRAESLGIGLWRDLPEAFQRFYWKELHGRDVSIAIYSQEPYIPWELVRPLGENGERGDFLGLSFRMARWRQALRFPDPLTVTGFSIIAPEYAPESGSRPLPGAQAEAQELIATFGAKPVPGTRAAVWELLESAEGGVELIHFAGHGEFDPDAKQDTVIRLADAPLIPDDLNSATLGRLSHPLVFLNACEVGEQGWALTRIGGWAQAFCDVGFSGFVGPYWAVNDRVARKAAVVFYTSLTRGLTVGEAIRDVRRRFYAQDEPDRGHPSWLAYTLHCQPNVHVRMPAAPGASSERGEPAAAGWGR